MDEPKNGNPGDVMDAFLKRPAANGCFCCRCKGIHCMFPHSGHDHEIDRMHAAAIDRQLDKLGGKS